MTTAERIAEVRKAIARVKNSADYVRMLNVDQKATTERVAAVRSQHSFALAEFGSHWENVEAILDALAPTPPEE